MAIFLFPHILSYSSRPAPPSPRSISLEMPTLASTFLNCISIVAFFIIHRCDEVFLLKNQSKLKMNEYSMMLNTKKNQICFWFPHFAVIEFSVDFPRCGFARQIERARDWPFSIELFMIIFEVTCDGIWKSLMEEYVVALDGKPLGVFVLKIINFEVMAKKIVVHF